MNDGVRCGGGGLPEPGVLLLVGVVCTLSAAAAIGAVLLAVGMSMERCGLFAC
jgi:hypothetical protein